MSAPAADDRSESTDKRSAREVHSLVVDRFEGDLAVVVVDGLRVVDLPRWLLPSGVREGDWVRISVFSGNETDRRELRFQVDIAATRARQEEARTLLKRLQRSPEG